MYYKTHLKLDVATLMDFSVVSGCLCIFSNLGILRFILYVQGGTIWMLKLVIYFEILLDFICILKFLSNFSTCSLLLIYFGSQSPSFLLAFLFLFLKGFIR